MLKQMNSIFPLFNRWLTDKMPFFALSPMKVALKDFLSQNEPAYINFQHGNTEYDFYWENRHKHGLIVFLPAATPGGDKRRVPYFPRWSWCKSFPSFDAVAIADPTLRLSKDILSGWMQVNKDDWGLGYVARLIQSLSRIKKYHTIICCGSSAGGFAAIQLASLLNSTSSNCKSQVFCYAENPQIDLYQYQWTKHIDKVASAVYGVAQTQDIPAEFAPRLNVLKTMSEYNSIPAGVVITKESDEHHYQVHFKALVEYLKAQNNTELKCKTIPFNEDHTGHTPLTFAKMKTELKLMLKNRP